MKILFIHGFVEDNTIFDEIRKLITQGEQIAINVNNVLKEWEDCPEVLDVQKFASHLVQKYQLSIHDCIIGHSMGGWIAAYIKQEIGCKIIQIASFTDQSKLITPLRNLTLVKYLTHWGLTQSSMVTTYLRKGYVFQQSKRLYDELIQGLIEMDKSCLYQQFQILMRPVKPLTITPDLRIHTLKDNIVRPPDEPFFAIAGDHFCLVYYPQEVAKAILKIG
jgi:hypothetical protein